MPLTSKNLISRLLAAVAITVAVAFTAEGCSSDARPEAVGGAGTTPTSTPPLTGSCSVEGQSRACHQELGRHDGVVDCFAGSQTCSGGLWGPCTGGASGGSLTARKLPPGMDLGSMTMAPVRVAVPAVPTTDPRAGTLRPADPVALACSGLGGPCTPCCPGFTCGTSATCVSCTPSCTGKTCGSDGCGGLCGTCSTGYACTVSGTTASCVCTPSCTGKACGTDGCGGSCGTCATGFVCGGSQTCVCNPACAGKNCGPDGCGGNCGTCPSGATCSSTTAAGVCLCAGSCTGKTCGDDGCGVSCGSCAAGTTCTSAGTCACVPSCTGKVCGSDGCGGSCGTCPSSTSCNATQTACACVPSCTGKVCGSDGCGGTCGTCATGTCNSAGTCVASCTPGCAGKVCGTDGCSGTCATCASGTSCNATQTACACAPSCIGKACGSDGCGGSCGGCAAGQACNSAGACVVSCTPSCAGKGCGSDGCGGSCGTCATGQTCTAAGVCWCTPSCTGKTCGPDGCGGTCGACAAGQSCTGGACACVPSCSGKVCGPDGCGGTCGSCVAGQTCSGGACVGGTSTSLPGSGPPVNCSSDVCNPYCKEFAAPADAGVAPAYTTVPGSVSYNSVGLGGVPGGFVKKGNRSPCSVPGDCNFDYHCDPVTKECVGNQTTRWFDTSCLKPDFTIGLPCTTNTFPVCNRGSKVATAGSVLSFYRKNGGGNQFGQLCYPTENCGTYTLQSDLIPGSCIDVGGGGAGDTTACFRSGNNTIYVNAKTAAGATLDECYCGNNWTDQKGAAVCTAVPPASAYATKTYDTTYTASCGLGTRVRWGYMSYDTTPASNVSGTGDVLFTIQTGTTVGGPYSVAKTVADTPNGAGGSVTLAVCAMTGPTPNCPVDVYAKLGAVDASNAVLHLQVTITPTPDKQATPVLNTWQITYSCVPNE